MKKNIISIQFATIIVTSLCMLSCTNDSNDAVQNTSQKSDLTAAEAHSFLSEYTAAKYDDKHAVIKKITQKNKIDVNESAVLGQTALNEYSPDQMLSFFPLDGGETGILPMYSAGLSGTIRRNLEWNVAKNTFGLWRVKSIEDITYSENKVHQAMHLGTRFEGLTMGVLEWEEFPAQASIQITGWERQVLSMVHGSMHMVGYNYSLVDNYCVFTIE